MAAAYSLDLRTKILNADRNKEGSQRDLAARFKVSLSFIRNLLRQYRETGEIAAKPRGGERRSKLKAGEREILREIVDRKNDIYLREMQSVIQSQTGIKVSTSSLCRTLDRWKLRRKKTLVASERETERVKKLRSEWRKWLDPIEIGNLIFIDETGINRSMTRRYGRGEGGVRVYNDCPGDRGKNLTLIGAMSDRGLIATMSLTGGLDPASFLV